MKAKFITFEGSEGSGKSTQSDLLFKYLKSKKLKVVQIREPGGVKISETIRRILLDVKNTKMTDVCETLLYMAARAQLVEEMIMPALKSGAVVLSDRFLDSTVVYQGYGNGVDIGFIQEVGKVATQGIVPDLTFIFDIDIQHGLQRKGAVRDRIEQRSMDYHNRVRKGYQELAHQDPERIRLIKVDRTPDEIQSEIRASVDLLLDLS